jgi:hypothetical protein
MKSSHYIQVAPSKTFTMSGNFRMFAISFCKRVTMSFGVPAGAITPYHELTSKPGYVYAIAGKSGIRVERLSLLTATPRSLPDLIKGMAPAMLMKAMSICPPTRSLRTGPAPL